MAELQVLDSGAIIGFVRGDRFIRAFVEEALEEDDDQVFIPAVVVAETIRGNGAHDAIINRLINDAEVIQTSETIARNAGSLLAKAKSSQTIDAIVVASAASKGEAMIVTSDPDDLRVLADSVPGVTIQPV
ncbi:MAG: PIN domain-containing protein [Acidimicrobiia bacterium]